MLAIAGGKGGCGKTTTTLGLAGALAERGYEPLVVDGDCDMPDVHHRLELSRTNGVDLLAGGSPLGDAIVRSDKLPGVALVTGGRRDALDTALRQVTCWDGPILVDCSAGTNPDSLRPLRHADRAVVVSTDQPQCIEDAALTRTIAGRLSTSITGVVLRTAANSSPWCGQSPVTTQSPEHSAVPAAWTILGEIPPVDRPLRDPQARESFVTISKSVVPVRTAVSGTRTEKDDTCGLGRNAGRNHQRY